MTSTMSTTHLPPLGAHERREIGLELQATLVELVDLSLVGKQLHWSVVGPMFRPLHQQLAGVEPGGIEGAAVVRELARRLAETSERIRGRMERLAALDAASEDVLIEVVRALEQQLWMVRAQLQEGGA
jgi:starvation-inducible DNA-binding protein